MIIRTLLLSREVGRLRLCVVNAARARCSSPERRKAVTFVLHPEVCLLDEGVASRVNALHCLSWQPRLAWDLPAHIWYVLSQLAGKVLEVRVSIVEIVRLRFLHLLRQDRDPCDLLLHLDRHFVQPLELRCDLRHAVEWLKSALTCVSALETIPDQLRISACHSIEFD